MYAKLMITFASSDSWVTSCNKREVNNLCVGLIPLSFGYVNFDITGGLCLLAPKIISLNFVIGMHPPRYVHKDMSTNLCYSIY